MPPFVIIALVLILARAIAELWLSRLNQRHVCAHEDEVPPAFRGMIDEATYRRSVDYTLAKNRFGDITGVFDTLVLIAVLFSGVLPWAFGRFSASFGRSIWAMAGFLFLVGIALSLPGLPFAWYAQFKLEQRFGFNTTAMKTWVLDRVKGFLLAVLLGYPLLALVLKLIEWTGANWWLWAAAVVIAFQLLLLLIAPAIIMPLFNHFRVSGIRRDRVAGAPGMVLSRFWFRASGRLRRRECRPCDAAVCAAGGDDTFLVFAARSHLVAPFRIRGGCIRARDNGRGAITHSSAAQIERKKLKQSHPAPALQRVLLFAPDPARTGTRAANSGLARATGPPDGHVPWRACGEAGRGSMRTSRLAK